MNEWKPIETVPLNTPVLLYSPERCEKCLPNSSGMFVGQCIFEGLFICGTILDTYLRLHHLPKYWKELPNKPEIKQ